MGFIDQENQQSIESPDSPVVSKFKEVLGNISDYLKTTKGYAAYKDLTSPGAAKFYKDVGQESANLAWELTGVPSSQRLWDQITGQSSMPQDTRGKVDWLSDLVNNTVGMILGASVAAKTVPKIKPAMIKAGQALEEAPLPWLSELYRRATPQEASTPGSNAFSALHDRIPRVEISDEYMYFKNLLGGSDTPRGYYTKPGSVVQDVIEHPELFKSVPEVAKTPISLDIRKDMKPHGAYYLDDKYMEASAPNQESARRVAIHELSHKLDEVGGMPIGGSPDEFTSGRASSLADQMWDQYSTLFDKYAEWHRVYEQSNGKNIQALNLARDFRQKARDIYAEWQKQSPEGLYRRLASEIQARDAAARADIPADRRPFIPYLSSQSDIPLEDMIVKMEKWKNNKAPSNSNPLPWE
jgi:hypothetical protein